MLNIQNFITIFIGFFDDLASGQGHGHIEKDIFQSQREDMVAHQIQIRGIRDARVLNTLRKIKRHLFVPEKLISFAYNDSPLPIDKNQTISQPYIVALMTELAEIKENHKILEVGTGSGYQTAILAELAEKVYSVEIIPELAEKAETRLLKMGYRNIKIIQADGYVGYMKEAPYDSIIVTAAADELPEELISQLKNGGKIIIPIGECAQELYCIKKNIDGSLERQSVIPVRFVPMIHPAK